MTMIKSPQQRGRPPKEREEIIRYLVTRALQEGFTPHEVMALLSIANIESSFNPRVVGDGGKSFGLFQFNVQRLPTIGLDPHNREHIQKLMDWKYNIEQALRLFKQFRAKLPHQWLQNPEKHFPDIFWSYAAYWNRPAYVDDIIKGNKAVIPKIYPAVDRQKVLPSKLAEAIKIAQQMLPAVAHQSQQEAFKRLHEIEQILKLTTPTGRPIISIPPRHIPEAPAILENAARLLPQAVELWRNAEAMRASLAKATKKRLPEPSYRVPEGIKAETKYEKFAAHFLVSHPEVAKAFGVLTPAQQQYLVKQLGAKIERWTQEGLPEDEEKRKQVLQQRYMELIPLLTQIARRMPRPTPALSERIGTAGRIVARLPLEVITDAAIFFASPVSAAIRKIGQQTGRDNYALARDRYLSSHAMTSWEKEKVRLIIDKLVSPSFAQTGWFLLGLMQMIPQMASVAGAFFARHVLRRPELAKRIEIKLAPYTSLLSRIAREAATGTGAQEREFREKHFHDAIAFLLMTAPNEIKHVAGKLQITPYGWYLYAQQLLATHIHNYIDTLAKITGDTKIERVVGHYIAERATAQVPMAAIVLGGGVLRGLGKVLGGATARALTRVGLSEVTAARIGASVESVVQHAMFPEQILTAPALARVEPALARLVGKGLTRASQTFSKISTWGRTRLAPTEGIVAEASKAAVRTTPATERLANVIAHGLTQLAHGAMTGALYLSPPNLGEGHDILAGVLAGMGLSALTGFNTMRAFVKGRITQHDLFSRHFPQEVIESAYVTMRSIVERLHPRDYATLLRDVANLAHTDTRFQSVVETAQELAKNWRQVERTPETSIQLRNELLRELQNRGLLTPDEVELYFKLDTRPAHEVANNPLDEEALRAVGEFKHMLQLLTFADDLARMGLSGANPAEIRRIVQRLRELTQASWASVGAFRNAMDEVASRISALLMDVGKHVPLQKVIPQVPEEAVEFEYPVTVPVNKRVSVETVGVHSSHRPLLDALNVLMPFVYSPVQFDIAVRNAKRTIEGGIRGAGTILLTSNPEAVQKALDIAQREGMNTYVLEMDYSRWGKLQPVYAVFAYGDEGILNKALYWFDVMALGYPLERDALEREVKDLGKLVKRSIGENASPETTYMILRGLDETTKQRYEIPVFEPEEILEGLPERVVRGITDEIRARVDEVTRRGFSPVYATAALSYVVTGNLPRYLHYHDLAARLSPEVKQRYPQVYNDAKEFAISYIKGLMRLYNSNPRRLFVFDFKYNERQRQPFEVRDTGELTLDDRPIIQISINEEGLRDIITTASLDAHTREIYFPTAIWKLIENKLGLELDYHETLFMEHHLTHDPLAIAIPLEQWMSEETAQTLRQQIRQAREEGRISQETARLLERVFEIRGAITEKLGVLGYAWKGQLNITPTETLGTTIRRNVLAHEIGHNLSWDAFWGEFREIDADLLEELGATRTIINGRRMPTDERIRFFVEAGIAANYIHENFGYDLAHNPYRSRMDFAPLMIAPVLLLDTSQRLKEFEAYRYTALATALTRSSYEYDLLVGEIRKILSQNWMQFKDTPWGEFWAKEITEFDKVLQDAHRIELEALSRGEQGKLLGIEYLVKYLYNKLYGRRGAWTGREFDRIRNEVDDVVRETLRRIKAKLGSKYEALAQKPWKTFREILVTYETTREIFSEATTDVVLEGSIYSEASHRAFSRLMGHLYETILYLYPEIIEQRGRGTRAVVIGRTLYFLPPPEHYERLHKLWKAQLELLENPYARSLFNALIDAALDGITKLESAGLFFGKFPTPLIEPVQTEPLYPWVHVALHQLHVASDISARTRGLRWTAATLTPLNIAIFHELPKIGATTTQLTNWENALRAINALVLGAAQAIKTRIAHEPYTAFLETYDAVSELISTALKPVVVDLLVNILPQRMRRHARQTLLVSPVITEGIRTTLMAHLMDERASVNATLAGRLIDSSKYEQYWTTSWSDILDNAFNELRSLIETSVGWEEGKQLWNEFKRLVEREEPIRNDLVSAALSWIEGNPNAVRIHVRNIVEAVQQWATSANMPQIARLPLYTILTYAYLKEGIKAFRGSVLEKASDVNLSPDALVIEELRKSFLRNVLLVDWGINKRFILQLPADTLEVLAKLTHIPEARDVLADNIGNYFVNRFEQRLAERYGDIAQGVRRDYSKWRRHIRAAGLEETFRDAGMHRPVAVTKNLLEEEARRRNIHVEVREEDLRDVYNVAIQDTLKTLEAVARHLKDIEREVRTDEGFVGYVRQKFYEVLLYPPQSAERKEAYEDLQDALVRKLRALNVFSELSPQEREIACKVAAPLIGRLIREEAGWANVKGALAVAATALMGLIGIAYSPALVTMLTHMWNYMLAIPLFKPALAVSAVALVPYIFRWIGRGFGLITQRAFERARRHFADIENTDQLRKQQIDKFTQEIAKGMPDDHPSKRIIEVVSNILKEEPMFITPMAIGDVVQALQNAIQAQALMTPTGKWRPRPVQDMVALLAQRISTLMALQQHQQLWAEFEELTRHTANAWINLRGMRYVVDNPHDPVSREALEKLAVLTLLRKPTTELVNNSNATIKDAFPDFAKAVVIDPQTGRSKTVTLKATDFDFEVTDMQGNRRKFYELTVREAWDLYVARRIPTASWDTMTATTQPAGAIREIRRVRENVIGAFRKEFKDALERAFVKSQPDIAPERLDIARTLISKLRTLKRVFGDPSLLAAIEAVPTETQTLLVLKLLELRHVFELINPQDPIAGARSIFGDVGERIYRFINDYLHELATNPDTKELYGQAETLWRKIQQAVDREHARLLRTKPRMRLIEWLNSQYRILRSIWRSLVAIPVSRLTIIRGTEEFATRLAHIFSMFHADTSQAVADLRITQADPVIWERVFYSPHIADNVRNHPVAQHLNDSIRMHPERHLPYAEWTALTKALEGIAEKLAQTPDAKSAGLTAKDFNEAFAQIAYALYSAANIREIAEATDPVGAALQRVPENVRRILGNTRGQWEAHVVGASLLAHYLTHVGGAKVATIQLLLAENPVDLVERAYYSQAQAASKEGVASLREAFSSELLETLFLVLDEGVRRPGWRRFFEKVRTGRAEPDPKSFFTVINRFAIASAIRARTAKYEPIIRALIMLAPSVYGNALISEWASAAGVPSAIRSIVEGLTRYASNTGDALQAFVNLLNLPVEVANDPKRSYLSKLFANIQVGYITFNPRSVLRQPFGAATIVMKLVHELGVNPIIAGWALLKEMARQVFADFPLTRWLSKYDEIDRVLMAHIPALIARDAQQKRAWTQLGIEMITELAQKHPDVVKALVDPTVPVQQQEAAAMQLERILETDRGLWNAAYRLAMGALEYFDRLMIRVGASLLARQYILRELERGNPITPEVVQRAVWYAKGAGEDTQASPSTHYLPPFFQHPVIQEILSPMLRQFVVYTFSLAAQYQRAYSEGLEALSKFTKGVTRIDVNAVREGASHLLNAMLTVSAAVLIYALFNSLWTTMTGRQMEEPPTGTPRSDDDWLNIASSMATQVAPIAVMRLWNLIAATLEGAAGQNAVLEAAQSPNLPPAVRNAAQNLNNFIRLGQLIRAHSEYGDWGEAIRYASGLGTPERRRYSIFADLLLNALPWILATKGWSPKVVPFVPIAGIQTAIRVAEERGYGMPMPAELTAGRVGVALQYLLGLPYMQRTPTMITGMQSMAGLVSEILRSPKGKSIERANWFVKGVQTLPPWLGFIGLLEYITNANKPVDINACLQLVNTPDAWVVRREDAPAEPSRLLLYWNKLKEDAQKGGLSKVAETIMLSPHDYMALCAIFGSDYIKILLGAYIPQLHQELRKLPREERMAHYKERWNEALRIAGRDNPQLAYFIMDIERKTAQQNLRAVAIRKAMEIKERQRMQMRMRRRQYKW